MSLRRKAASGVKWITSSTATVAVIGLLQTIILSRILSPTDFGLMAMVWVVLGLVQMFADMGLGNALVQKREVTEAQLSSAFWLTVAAGMVLALVGIALAPLTAQAYRQPVIAGFMPLLCLVLIVISVGQMHWVLAQRAGAFHRLAIADMLASVTGLLVSTLSALTGSGVWSLVFGSLGSACAKSGYLFLTGCRNWIPGFHFRWSDLREFTHFGAYQMVDRISNYTWSNVDYFLAGRSLGAGPLGLYRLAYEVVVRPLGTVNPILNTVSYPLFSQRQDDNEALQRGFLEMIRVLCIVTFPLLAGLYVVAPLAVQVVFGPKWAGTAPLIRILCLLGALRSLANPGSTLLMAKGRIRSLSSINAFQAAVSLIALPIAVQYGIVALSWTVVGVMVLVFVVSWKIYYFDSIRLPFLKWLQPVLRPLCYAFAMGAVTHILARNLTDLVPRPSLRLAALVAVGSLVYGLLLWMFERSYLHDLWNLVKGGSQTPAETKV